MCLHKVLTSISCFPDCRENVLLQSVYHPGLFVNGKWSCCDHRSKHSQGCQASFCGNQQQEHPPTASGPATSYISSNKPTGGVPRGPLPPTPSNEVAPTPPPHSSASRYHQSHGTNPDTIQGYEQHELKPPNERRRGGGGGGGAAGGGIGSGANPNPPPVPVSYIC